MLGESQESLAQLIMPGKESEIGTLVDTDRFDPVTAKYSKLMGHFLVK